MITVLTWANALLTLTGIAGFVIESMRRAKRGEPWN